MNKSKKPQEEANLELEQAPEELVPEEFVKDGRYVQGGYRCRKCAFVTSKPGFSGRQALRAHLKVHTRERRAWARPMAYQGLTSVALIAAGTAGYLLPFRMSGGLPVPGHAIAWSLTGAGAVALGALLVATLCAGGVLTRGAIACGWVVVAVSALAGAVAAAAAWTPSAPGWPHMLAVAAALVLAPYTAGSLGDSAHRGRRGHGDPGATSTFSAHAMHMPWRTTRTIRTGSSRRSVLARSRLGSCRRSSGIRFAGRSRSILVTAKHAW